MKTRHGFVSNSSSSSFVVAFDRRPKTVDEVLDCLFPDRKSINPYGDAVSTCEAATAIFRQLQDQKRCMTKKQVREAVYSGWFDGYPECNWNDSPKFDPKNRKEWDDWHKARCKEIDAAAHALADKFMAENEGKKFYHFSFSDNDGPAEAALEHGDTFKNAPHLTISHH